MLSFKDNFFCEIDKNLTFFRLLLSLLASPIKDDK
jgi:hypothetical protein